jgi:hypothetical protein
MELGGGGGVLKALSTLNDRNDIFSYGITQSDQGVGLFKPGSPQHGEFATFAYLSKQVPAPFRAEFSGGMGQVIHNKFVVVDFDGDNPAVFTGSSNLAVGGEAQNGDNLLAIYDRRIATAYAVEAIRLVDHYHFRMLQKQHASTAPVTLQGPGAAAPWWQAAYQPGSNKFQERVLFAGGTPPPVSAAGRSGSGAAAGDGKAKPAATRPVRPAAKPKSAGTAKTVSKAGAKGPKAAPPRGKKKTAAKTPRGKPAAKPGTRQVTAKRPAAGGRIKKAA